MPAGVVVQAAGVFAETDLTTTVTVFITDAFPDTNSEFPFSIRWTASALGLPRRGTITYGTKHGLDPFQPKGRGRHSSPAATSHLPCGFFRSK